MKVVYLTFGETPRSHGIYGSQVLPLISDLASRPEVEMRLIAATPVVHSGLTRERWSYRQELGRVKERARPASFQFVPLPIPQPVIFPSRKTFGAPFIGLSRTVVPALREARPDIVHCRSLQATWAAVEARRRAELEFAVVYDPRSLWPEMQVRKSGRLSDLEPFRAIERSLVESVDGVAAVNEPMASHYRRLGAAHVIVAGFRAPAPGTNREDGRIGWTAARPVEVVYAGAIRSEGVQDPRLLFSQFRSVSDLVEARLTLVSTSSQEPIQRVAEELLGERAGLVRWRPVRDSRQMPMVLAEHDLALNAYRRPTSELTKLLAETGFSTKSSEYLAAGLPILCSPHPLAIREVIERNQLGAICGDGTDIDKPRLISLLSGDVSARCRATARRLFSPENVATRYVALYRSLL